MQKPPCFGVVWEGIDGSQCCSCQLSRDCFLDFARVRLGDLRQANPDLPLNLLSAQSNVSVESLERALNYRREAKLDSENMDQADSSVSGDQPMPKKSESAGSDTSKQKRKPRARGKAGAKKAAGTKAVVEPTQDVTQPEIAEQEAASEPVNPLEASSAKAATGLAEPNPDCAKPVMGQDVAWTWGIIHDEARNLREKAKNPEIAALTIGQLLKKEWPRKSGNIFTVRVQQYCYKIMETGQEWPTLQAAEVAIAGYRKAPKPRKADGTRELGTRNVAICSAKRFFGLEKRKSQAKRPQQKK